MIKHNLLVVHRTFAAAFHNVGRRSPRFQQSQQQKRTFIDSILNSALGPCPERNLTHTKKLPHSAGAVFKAVADVSGYPAFLPFTIASNVTQRDASGYPSQASLKIGYDKFGIEEYWNSRVKCDPQGGIIEAQSSEQNSQGLFEVLQTRWQIQPTKAGRDQTSVKLDLRVKFRNPVYDKMFAQVEGKVANAMITAFEQRVRELDRKS